MSRLTQAVVLFLFGGAILRASVTDLFLRYVKAGLRPYLIAAGVLLIVAAAMTLWSAMRARSTSSSLEEEDHDGHGHAHHEPRVGWLLVLPVLGLLLVSPPALGSFAAGKAGSVSAAPASGSDYPPLPAGDPAQVGLLDYASRALFDDGKSLTGRNLRMSGFVTPGPDGQPMLARIVLTCCAADGRPIKVGMTGKVPLDVPADTWIQVDGVYTAKRAKDPANNVDMAYVEVKSWEAIPEPKQPYS
ncbi:TIGR03943 family putative permease subunit [Actinoplanes subtropicus]|uniref:TIGR03943 family putative permease subunit n=1 Tax=Actinoplanes subtropicus TaxID=543632 RepID=UPI0004C3E9EE|nr:TIGR03943 family protein [Actinoplanes subtropicus]